MGKLYVAHDRYGGAVVSVIHEAHYTADNKGIHDAWLHDLHRQGRDIVVTMFDEEQAPDTPLHVDGKQVQGPIPEPNGSGSHEVKGGWGHQHVVAVPYAPQGHPLYDAAEITEVSARVGGPHGASVTEVAMLKRLMQKQADMFEARMSELKALIARKGGS
jgi:hypothetical protein